MRARPAFVNIPPLYVGVILKFDAVVLHVRHLAAQIERIVDRVVGRDHLRNVAVGAVGITVAQIPGRQVAVNDRLQRVIVVVGVGRRGQQRRRIAGCVVEPLDRFEPSIGEVPELRTLVGDGRPCAGFGVRGRGGAVGVVVCTCVEMSQLVYRCHRVIRGPEKWYYL